MSIIIRLQNLPWDATALNVRQFFYGLSIPDGGVHIIGGEKGDVFIAFSTDEDARQAMKNDNGFIGGTQIKLFLSSKAEMQSVISAAREQNSQPITINHSAPNTGGMVGPMNQFGGPQGPGFASMRLPFTSQPGIPPMGLPSRFRGPLDLKEPNNFPFRPPFVPNEIRPGLDFRHPMGPANDFRPPFYDQRGAPFDQLRFPSFDAKQTNLPYNKSFQSMAEDKGAKSNSFQESRGGDFWNGNQMNMLGPQSIRSLDSSRDDGYPHASSGNKFDRKFEMGDRMMPLVMYPSNELFKKVNDNKDRGDMEMKDYSDLASKYSNRDNVRNVESEMQKMLKNIDDRIAAAKALPPSLLTTPINMKAVSDLNANSNNNRKEASWRPDSGARQRSRSPAGGSRRDSKYGASSRGDGGVVGKSDSSYSLRIENLPPTFTYRDVRTLFKEFEISKSNLKLLLDRSGRRSGECLLKVSSVSHVEIVLKNNGRIVDGYRLDVSRCHDRDFDNAVDFLGAGSTTRTKSRSRSPIRREPVENGGYYVVIKKLPFSSVWKCLDGVRVHKDGGPFMEVKPNGAETGHILVELERKRDFTEMLDRCKKFYDSHQAFIFGISKSEFKDRIEGSKLMKKEKEKPIEKESGDTCVRLNGLSWSANEDKVVKFFSSSKIVPNGLHILLEDNGKPSGDAYIEFETASDCAKALEKNNQYLDNRYLIIAKIKKSEMISQLMKYASRGGKLMNNMSFIDRQRSDDNNMMIGRSNSSNLLNTRNDRLPMPLRAADSGPSILFMHNLSFRTQLEDILEFFEGYKVIPESVQLQYKDDQPTGDGMVQLTSRSEAERALRSLNHKMMLGRVVRLDF